MTKTLSPITTECTVDAVIATTPGAVPVLNAHNIDTCCGGRKSIGEAAAHAHVDPAVLIGALQAAPAKSCGCGCK